MTYSDDQLAQRQQDMRYKIVSCLPEVAAATLRGADTMQCCDVVCQKLNICFLDQKEWNLVGSIRDYILGQ